MGLRIYRFKIELWKACFWAAPTPVKGAVAVKYDLNKGSVGWNIISPEREEFEWPTELELPRVECPR
jgi:hypothetical protein